MYSATASGRSSWPCGQAAQGGAHLAADLGRADLDMQSRQQIERRGVAGRIAQRVGAHFRSPAPGVLRAGSASMESPAGRTAAEVVEALAGTRSHDQRRDKRDLRAAMPAAQAKKGVGAHQAKQGVAGGKLGTQAQQRVDCVVGLRSAGCGAGASASEIAKPGSPAMARRVIARRS